MLSHDLARELLKRRNNDVRFSMVIDTKGEASREVHDIRMRDDSENPENVIPPTAVVTYFPTGDYIIIELDVLELGYGDND